MNKNLMEIFVNDDLNFLTSHGIDYIGTYIDKDYAVAALESGDYNRLMRDLYDHFEAAEFFSIKADNPWLTDDMRTAAVEVTLDFNGYQVMGWAPVPDEIIGEPDDIDNDTMYHSADTYIFCDDINDWVYEVMGATTESEAQQLIYDLAYGNELQVSELLWHIAYTKRKGEDND
jgi:hypothetical protein